MMKVAPFIVVLTTTLAGCAGLPSSGRAEVYHYENGAVSLRAWRDSVGRFNGKDLGYWPSGQLAEESYWDHGVPVRGRFYSEAGILISEVRHGTGWRQCPEHGEYYLDGKYIRGHH